jgi:DNA-directed RNA polymerase subunit N
VRCFSCGFPVDEEYRARVNAGEKPERVLDELGIKRYCCRRMLVSQVDLIDEILPFKRY